MVGKPHKRTKEVSTGTGDRIQKTAESSSDISAQGKHDDVGIFFFPLLLALLKIDLNRRQAAKMIYADS